MANASFHTPITITPYPLTLPPTIGRPPAHRQERGNSFSTPTVQPGKELPFHLPVPHESEARGQRGVQPQGTWSGGSDEEKKAEETTR